MKQQNFAFKNLKRKGMKPTDLMVNDWVLWKNKYVRVVETSAIVYSFGQIDVRLAYCNDDGDGIERHDISKISPIPLTPEILEKNGWKETEYWHEYNDGNTIIQYSLSNIWGIINGIEIEHFKCEYVHQLQHLLRLCGLDELADNFKV